MSKQDSAPKTRWFALLMTTALLLLWGAGLVHAVRGGLDPGYVSHPANRPYPVVGVLTVCGIITIEAGVLFVILRPFNLSNYRRVLIALAVFVPLWFLEFFLISGVTDQAGYCYANGFFLSCSVCFLGIAAVLSFLMSRRRRQATIDNAAQHRA